MVSKLLLPRGLISGEQEFIFKSLWKSPAPSKIAGLAWLVLLDRVPTRQNLYRRQVIRAGGDCNCCLCGEEIESTSHLFLYCRYTLQVWKQVFGWLGLSLCFPHNTMSMLACFASSTGPKWKRKGMVMIWNTVIWSIWRHRNKIVFEGGVSDLSSLIEVIKVSSWRWWIGRKDSPPCLLYEWLSEPGVCLNMG
jgi:hypothetical protein